MAIIPVNIENLKPNKEYIVTVRSKNNDVNVVSAYTDSVRFSTPTDSTIPNAPTNLVLAASFLNVLFSYTDSVDEDAAKYEYELYKQEQIESVGGGYQVISAATPLTPHRTGFVQTNVFLVSVDDNSATTSTSSVTNPVKYYGRVRTIDSAGNISDWTSIVASGDTPLIDEEFIGSLTAAKITAGTIGAHEIILTQPGTTYSYTPPANMAVLRTSNYQSGSTGWLIRGDGLAEFNNITVRGTVEATAGTFKGAIDIGGPDDASLQVDTDGNLWIGDRDFNDAKFRVTNTGNFTTTGTGNISGTLTVTSNTTIGSGTAAGGSPYSELLRVNGTTVLAGTTYVIGSTNISSTLSVTGNTTVGSGTAAGGAPYNELLRVNGTTVLAGTTYVTGGTTVSGNLSVSGTTTLTGTTTLNGNLTFGNNAPIVQVNNGKIRGNNGTVYWEVDSSGFRAGFSEGASNIVSVGQTLRVLGGSAASPAIGFSGDDDTGFYQVTANQFGVSAGGSLAAYFTSDPYVIAYTPNTTNSTTVRVHTYGFGYTTLGYPSSKREFKNNINEISNSLAIIEQLKPSTFKWNRMPDDDDFKAELRSFVTNYGFIAEEVAEVDSQLATWEPYSWDGMTEEDKKNQMLDLDSWIPSYWSESAMIAVCVAAIKDIAKKLKDNNIL